MPAPEGYSVNTMKEFIGHDFGVSKPIDVHQIRINTFADVTGDHQWIHIHPEMAKKHSPFGGAIAHGFLTLSLMAANVQDVGVAPQDAKGVLNYGVNKVRFLSPVMADAKVATAYTLKDVEEKGQGMHLITLDATMSVEGQDKPAVVAELLAMVMG